MADRAVVFVDGNNFYHGLRDVGVTTIGEISLAKVSKKLIGPRKWISTKYYVGRVQQTGNTQLYSSQRSYIARQKSADRRVEFYLGRLEPRRTRNPLADELLAYLGSLSVRIDRNVYRHIVSLARKHRSVEVQVEKAVDVMLAVDLVVLAERNEYDAAYVLSADGDYTHAVEFARGLGKRIYAVSPRKGGQLAAVVNSYIPTPKAWYQDCYFKK